MRHEAVARETRMPIHTSSHTSPYTSRHGVAQHSQFAALSRCSCRLTHTNSSQASRTAASSDSMDSSTARKRRSSLVAVTNPRSRSRASALALPSALAG